MTSSGGIIRGIENWPEYGLALELVRKGHNVTVIDGATNAVITTIPTGYEPWAIVYNPTTNKVYCANALGNNVTVIDGATSAVIATIAVGAKPQAVTWNSVQNRIYVVNYHGSSISVLRDVTGIEKDTKHDVAHAILQILPNPAKTFLTINTVATVRSIEFYDVLGKLLREEDMTKYDHGKTISVRNMSAGVYFLKVNTKNNEFIRKIVVTK